MKSSIPVLIVLVVLNGATFSPLLYQEYEKTAVGRVKPKPEEHF